MADDGGPAFPQPGDRLTYGSAGMSLRDYFAAKAMEALIDGYDHEARCASQDRNSRTGFDDKMHEDSETTYASNMAEEAYLIADAMLAARGK